MCQYSLRPMPVQQSVHHIGPSRPDLLALVEPVLQYDVRLKLLGHWLVDPPPEELVALTACYEAGLGEAVGRLVCHSPTLLAAPESVTFDQSAEVLQMFARPVP